MPEPRTVLLIKAGFSLTFSPPLGLLTISSVLKQGGVHTEVYDLTVRPDRTAELLDRCRLEPPLWAGLSAMTPDIPAVTDLAARIKAVNPAIPLILGGIHGSFLPAETLAEVPVDAVVRGEGEDRVLALTEMVRSGNREFWRIPQVASRGENGGVRMNETACKPVDIRPLPPPDWDAVRLEDYQRRPWQLIKRGKRVAPVLTSRGCPFHCTFCSSTNYMGSKFRKRRTGDVLDEIEMLVHRHGVDEIQVADEIFNADLAHAKAILAGIIERRIPIHWKTPDGMHLEIVDDAFIDLVVRSGAYQVGFGIESGCPEILANIRRKMDLDRAGDILARYKRAGLSTFGFFILGLPGETLETVDRTIDYACSVALDHVHVGLCIPYPGSEIYNDLDRKGLLHHRWGEYRHFNGFPVSGLSGDRLKRSLRRFYLRFYSRPHRAFGLVNELVRNGMSGMAYVGKAYLGNRSIAS